MKPRVIVIGGKESYHTINKIILRLRRNGFDANPFYDRRDFRNRDNLAKHITVFKRLMDTTDILYVVIYKNHPLDYYIQDDIECAKDKGVRIVYSTEPNKHEIVTMCGPHKFYYEMFMEAERLRKLDKIVFMPQMFIYTEDRLSSDEFKKVNTVTGMSKLDVLHSIHHQMIDMSNWVYVIDVGGYYGDDTAREIEYAKMHDKKIRYFSKQSKTFLTDIEENKNVNRK